MGVAFPADGGFVGVGFGAGGDGEERPDFVADDDSDPVVDVFLGFVVAAAEPVTDFGEQRFGFGERVLVRRRLRWLLRMTRCTRPGS